MKKDEKKNKIINIKKYQEENTLLRKKEIDATILIGLSILSIILAVANYIISNNMENLEVVSIASVIMAITGLIGLTKGINKLAYIVENNSQSIFSKIVSEDGEVNFKANVVDFNEYKKLLKSKQK